MELLKVEFYWNENGIEKVDYIYGIDEQDCLDYWRQEFPERLVMMYRIIGYVEEDEINLWE